MKHFIKAHPVLSYYLLVFGISWGGLLLLIGGPRNIPGNKEQAEALFAPALLILFAGPFISGMLMNFLMDGKKGLRTLLARFLVLRIKGHWYALALLTAPVLVSFILFGLSLFNQDFMPGIITAENRVGLVLFGVSWGLLGGGLLEETGWTGFAVPHLRKQYSIFHTGLIAGLLWGLWHFMIAFWASNYLAAAGSYPQFVAGFLAFYLVALPAYRILLVWVYDRTNSLSLVMLMHASLSASSLIFQPASTGWVSFTWNAALGIILWLIIIALAVANPSISRKPPG